MKKITIVFSKKDTILKEKVINLLFYYLLTLISDRKGATHSGRAGQKNAGSYLSLPASLCS